MDRDIVYLIDETTETASRFIWVDGGGHVFDTIRAFPDATHGIFIKGDSEQGHRWPPQEDYIEPTPSKWADQYRSSIYKPRVYSFDVVIIGRNRSEFESYQGDWDRWHNPTLGEGVFKRITAGGLTRCLDCIPRPAGADMPEWEHAYSFKQEYLASLPWWRCETLKSVEARFDAGNTVALEWNNLGQVPAWPYVLIVGKVRNPVLTNANGDMMDLVKLTVNSDDEIRIDCRPNTRDRMSAWYYVHGAGVRTPVSMSSLSKYWSLPTGISTVTLTCDAGNARCIFQAYDYYGGLYVA